MNEENRFDLATRDAEDITPYDISYPAMLLSNGIKAIPP